jgi:plasmid stabilization system protein ParE
MSFRVILERHAEEDFTEHTDYIARGNPAATMPQGLLSK